MQSSFRRSARVFVSLCLLSGAGSIALAQSNSGVLTGVLTDPAGAVITDAKVTLQNPVSGLFRTATTDSAGRFQFTNLPFNSYHLVAEAGGFTSAARDASVASTVPVTVSLTLKVAGSDTTVNVETDDLVSNDPTFRTPVDRGLFSKVPLESQSSTLSSLVTLASPGVASDSNGLFHGLGDHASNSFSVDGQPISDQQSKVFSNQIPSNAIQSLEAIPGAPPAEYGGKTSLVINVTTRSGQGMTPPHGALTTSYGSFGSSTASLDVGYGGTYWGNFFEVDGLNTNRFLDPPEFQVFHAKGNEQNVFDRIDYQFNQKDSLHLNLNYSRSWFQNPNAFDNVGIQNVVSGGTTASPVFGPVGSTDQHSKIETYDIAPLYTRVIGANAVLNFGAYVRRDAFHYYPSGNVLADLGPIQSQSIDQNRTLTNAGVRSDYSIQYGRNNIKVGGVYQHTFLRENDGLGIVNATFNAPCVDATGAPLPGFTDPGQCATSGFAPNDGSDPAVTATPFNPNLLAYDQTRGGTRYHYVGRTDVKELGLYAQDQIKAGNWVFNLGIRGDLYNGLTIARQAQPRLGTSYQIAKTGTVLRLSYARTLETPFNENLVLSSQGCGNAVLSPLLNCTPGVSTTVQPGFRNEFHAGFQQTFGPHLVVSGDYIWKYTHSAFDFAILGNTPIFFPIDWHNSKTPGFVLRANVPTYHNFTAFVNMSSVSARFFPPQNAGAGATVGQSGYPFRIDHDEKFNATTFVQYQVPGKRGPWVGFNWRYDSGLNAGSTPCYNAADPNSHCASVSTLINGQPAIDLSGLTADQQAEAGLACGGVAATRTTPIPGIAGGPASACFATQLTSSLLSIPAPGTENDDRNPSRIRPRSLFDASIGDDNLLGGEKYRWSLRLTGVNLANKAALYNFLSTFSGTHYVTPRALTAEVGFHF